MLEINVSKVGSGLLSFSNSASKKLVVLLAVLDLDLDEDEDLDLDNLDEVNLDFVNFDDFLELMAPVEFQN